MERPQAKTAVVDMGTAWTKYGFAGEACPRGILRTPTHHVNSAGFLKGVLLDRLQCHGDFAVVFCEELFLPRAARENLLRHSLLGAGASRAALVSSDLCVAVAATTDASPEPTCLVVDCGWSHTSVVPVVAGCVVTGCAQWLFAGLSRAADRLWRASKWAPASQTLSSQLYAPLAPLPAQWLPSAAAPGATQGSSARILAEEIAAKFCLGDCDQSLSKTLGGVSFTTNCGALSAEVPAAARTSSMVALIDGCPAHSGSGGAAGNQEAEEDDDDTEAVGVADVVVRCLERCPVDMRKRLAKRIVCSGGCWSVPGSMSLLASCVKQKLAAHSRLSALAEHAAIVWDAVGHFPANCLSWAGAAALVSSGCIPDSAWSSRSPVDGSFAMPPDWTALK